MGVSYFRVLQDSDFRSDREEVLAVRRGYYVGRQRDYENPELPSQGVGNR